MLTHGATPYDALRRLAERLGGRMWFQVGKSPLGAWIVELGGRARVFKSDGDSYPELDGLYASADGEVTEGDAALRDDAEERFVGLVEEPGV